MEQILEWMRAPEAQILAVVGLVELAKRLGWIPERWQHLAPLAALALGIAAAIFWSWEQSVAVLDMARYAVVIGLVAMGAFDLAKLAGKTVRPNE